MSAHTPEPWTLEGDDELWVSGPDRQEPVICDMVPRDEGSFTGEDEANARRIVAAVNACTGISTEALERGLIALLVEYGETMVAVVEGRPGRNPFAITDDVKALLALLKEGAGDLPPDAGER